MLRRIIASLLLGAFCCTLTACVGEPAPPVTKDTSGNPVDNAKKNGNEFSGNKVE